MRGLWCLFLLGACYRGAAGDSCKVRCDDGCPSGMSCVGGYCTSGAICAGAPDAVVDSPRDAARDAPADAAADARPIDAPAASVAFVQHAEAGGYASSLTATFALAQHVGDLDVVVIDYASSQTIASVTDTSGNTYAVAASPVANSSAGAQVIYYAHGIAAAAAGANTVTVTFSTSGSVLVRTLEYGGVSATQIASVGTMGSGTAVDSGALALGFAPALLVAADMLADSSVMTDPAYTLRSDYYGNIVEDRVVTTTGTYNATDTQNTAGGWDMQLVAFGVR